MVTLTPSALRECFPCRAITTDEKKLRRLLIMKEEIQDMNMIGRSCHLIFNYSSMTFIYVDHKFKEITGYDSDRLLIHGAYFLNNIICSEDTSPYLLSLKKIQQYLFDLPVVKRKDYQFSFDFRIRHANGKLLRLLQQIIALEFDDKGNLMYSLDRYTDITHWEKEEETILAITGPDSSKSVIYYPNRKSNGITESIFTKTEIKILKLLSEGLSSKEIADRASISFNTVNTHRRNMLRKAKVKNTTELIQYAYINTVI